MKQCWTHLEIDAPAEALWELLTDVESWPGWGPTVQRAVLQGAELEDGATGTVTTILGVQLGFEITDDQEGLRWSWRVAGVPATGHMVESIGADRCRVSFGVAWPALPYLAVCQVALRRLDKLAQQTRAGS